MADLGLFESVFPMAGRAGAMEKGCFLLSFESPRPLEIEVIAERQHNAVRSYQTDREQLVIKAAPGRWAAEKLVRSLHFDALMDTVRTNLAGFRLVGRGR